MASGGVSRGWQPRSTLDEVNRDTPTKAGVRFDIGREYYLRLRSLPPLLPFLLQRKPLGTRLA